MKELSFSPQPPGSVVSQRNGVTAKKVVYFATGTPQLVAADLERLGLTNNAVSLLVVAPESTARQVEILSSLKRGQVAGYRLWSVVFLWLRLWKFLGLSGKAEVICLSDCERHRFLKLLAMTLRGDLAFSRGNDTLSRCSLLQLVWVAVCRKVAARGPICIFGSAAPECLQQIVADVRQRFPGVPLHGVLSAALPNEVDGWFDSTVRWVGLTPTAYGNLFSRSVGLQRFRRIILPWTVKGSPAWKWLGWFLPVWHVEIYNDNIDAFAGRNPWLLVQHWLWAIRQRREARLRMLPLGVIGSASALYLKQIVAQLHAAYPGVPLHALLPQSLEQPTDGLFDKVVRVPLGRWWAFPALWWRMARLYFSYQAWVIPCTCEPYHHMKFLAFCLPLARRNIFNELADGFPVRNLRMLWRHFRWRLRDHLSFQIVAGAAGGNFVLRLAHLGLYFVRLLAGVPLLLQARMRSYGIQRASGRKNAGRRNQVDLLVLGTPPKVVSGLNPFSLTRSAVANIRLVHVPRDFSLTERINTAIRESEAEFVCLVDGESSLSPASWLDCLLEMFDERTAQVGPQVVTHDGGTLIRGLLFGGRGLEWNYDNAVSWRGRPEWLEVEGLPWVCIVFRRSVFSQVGLFSSVEKDKGLWIDPDFSRRLAAYGWCSLCNRKVTATLSAKHASGTGLDQRLVQEEIGF